MGDTCYRPDLLANPELKKVDLLILPINGAFGNLNEEQSVEVIKVLQPKLAIPCHYGNFAEHGGSPQLFMKYAKSAQIAYRIMRQGEGIRI
jgi:L-ascorbate 6-phosphate lactonase